MNNQGRIIFALLGTAIMMVLAMVVVVVDGGCTPASQQNAVALAPAAGEVICVQVVTDQHGQQVCRVAADVLADLLPLVLAVREAQARAADGGQCRSNLVPFDESSVEAGSKAPPGVVPGAEPR